MCQEQSWNINGSLRDPMVDDAYSRIPAESAITRKAYRARGHRCIVIFPHTRDARGEMRGNLCNAMHRSMKNIGLLFDNLVLFSRAFHGRLCQLYRETLTFPLCEKFLFSLYALILLFPYESFKNGIN